MTSNKATTKCASIVFVALSFIVFSLLFWQHAQFYMSIPTLNKQSIFHLNKKLNVIGFVEYITSNVKLLNTLHSFKYISL